MDCTLQIFLDDRWVDCAQIELNGGLCLTIDDVAVRSAEFKEMMSAHGMLGTGTTGVQGAAPKYLLTWDRAGLLHGDAILPDAMPRST